jgi:hypothetical protein
MMSFKKFNLAVLALTAILSVAGPIAFPQSRRLPNDDTNPRIRLNQTDQQKLERFRKDIAGAPGFEKFRDRDRIDESYNPSANRTRVIVLLRLEGSLPQRERFRSERNRATWRGEVSGRQTEVINGLAGRGIAVLARYQNFPALVCEVTTEGLRALMAHPNVEAIQPDTLVEKHTAQGIPLMHADTLRTLHDGAGVTIAIIDDGVDYTHPDLGNGGFPNSKVISGYDIANKDADPFPSNASHGTSVSGIAAGNIPSPITSDYIGGVAPGAKIAAVKVFQDGNSLAYDSDVVQGIDWCVTNQNLDPNNPIMVISMSLGGGNYASSADAAYTEAVEFASINTAVAAGIAVIASSGNNGYCHSMAAPAALNPVISVGAVYDDSLSTATMTIDASSCYPYELIEGKATATQTTGPGVVTAYSNTADFLSLLAPSHNAYTTATGGGYKPNFGGTSAASPYVAGVVALLQSAARAETGSFLTPDTVRALLTTTGTFITDTKGGGISPGIVKPLVNAQAAYATITFGGLPEISVSDSSLSFIMPTATSSTKPLLISNKAASGGLDARFSAKATVSGSVENNIGSAQSQTPTTTTQYYGNIFHATSNSNLTLIEAYLNFKGTVLFNFVVYEAESLSSGSTSTIIYNAMVNLPSTGPGFYSSGPVEIPLQAGKYYIVATGWGSSNVGAFYDANPAPLVSFGNKDSGVLFIGTFPLSATLSNNSLIKLPWNIYQRIMAGNTSWLSINPSSGSMAPGMNENIDVTADAMGLTPGTYQGKVTITSNDSDERQFDIPVGLRIGLLGDVYVRFDHLGAEFGTMAAPYNTLGEAQEAIDSGPSAKITILGGGMSPETLTLTKQVTIQSTGGDATIGKAQ